MDICFLYKSSNEYDSLKQGSSNYLSFQIFVEKVWSWFPEEGTVSIAIWKKVGERLQNYYDVHRVGKILVDTFSLRPLNRAGREKWVLEKESEISSPETGVDVHHQDRRVPSDCQSLASPLECPPASRGAGGGGSSRTQGWE